VTNDQSSLVSNSHKVSRCRLAPIRYNSVYLMCTDHHQSVQSGLLSAPHTSTNYSDCSFVVHGPCAWNSLPAELRSLDTLDTFRQTKDFFVLSVTADLAHLWHCAILRFTKFFNNNNNRSVLVAIYLQS